MNNSPYAHFQFNPLKSLVEDKNFLFFPIRNHTDKARLKALTLKQYAQKISIYLISIRYIN